MHLERVREGDCRRRRQCWNRLERQPRRVRGAAPLVRRGVRCRLRLELHAALWTLARHVARYFRMHRAREDDSGGRTVMMLSSAPRERVRRKANRGSDTGERERTSPRRLRGLLRWFAAGLHVRFKYGATSVVEPLLHVHCMRSPKMVCARSDVTTVVTVWPGSIHERLAPMIADRALCVPRHVWHVARSRHA